MKDWIQRIVDELDALVKRAEKLDEFLESDEYETLDHGAQMALLSQCHIMSQYKGILEYRIVLSAIDGDEK